MTPQEAFGHKLRRQRERTKVTLQAIAHETKISRWLLEALETGDCSRWPGGIYSRAYIRSYAGAVGLDREELVGEFAELFPELAWAGGRAAQEHEAAAHANEPPRRDAWGVRPARTPA